MTGDAFRFQSKSKKVTLVNNGSRSVEFSDALSRMLGFSADTRYQPRNFGQTAPRALDMSTVIIPTLYVYCDVLGHVVVGDVVAPLLRLNMKVTQSHAAYQIMNPPCPRVYRAGFCVGIVIISLSC